MVLLRLSDLNILINSSFTFPVIRARCQCGLESRNLDYHTHLQIPEKIGLSVQLGGEELAIKGEVTLDEKKHGSNARTRS